MIDCLSREIHARATPLGAGEVDWMLLETTFWSRQPEEERFYRSTLIVSGVASSPVGACLVPLADEWRGVTCRYGRSKPDPDEGWLATTGAHDGAIEFGVVYAEPSDAFPAEALDRLMARMKADGVRHVVLVCADLSLRQALRNADSFIVGSAETDMATAGVVADILHNLVQAPATLNCFDFEDLSPPIGSADRPAIVAEALHKWNSGEIDFVGPEDEAAFDSARFVALLPTLGRTQIRQLLGLLEIVRTRLEAREVEVSYAAPRYGFHATWNSARVIPVRFLCM